MINPSIIGKKSDKKAVCIRLQDEGRETLSRFVLFSGLDKQFECVLLEPPWKNNEHFVSCLPPGDYLLGPRFSEKHGHHLEITGKGVEDRGPVLIHVGNDLTDTQGCQCAGQQFKDLNGDKLPDVTNSVVTMGLLIQFVTEKIPYKIVAP